MSTLTASPGVTNRSSTVTTAALFLALAGVLGLLAAPAGLGEVGAAILISALVFTVLRFVAAIGLWHCRRWAAILGFVVTLLDTLLALPGAFGAAPNAALAIVAAIGVALGVATLVLLALPASRRAYS